MIGQDTLDLDLPEPEHDHRLIGTCPVRGCKHTRSTRDRIPTHTCPKHGRPLKWAEVKGTYKHGIRCDARCQYAKGPDCECSCSGANHGAGWIE